MILRLLRALSGAVLTLLLGGLLAALLVRHAPGFGADEILLDGRMGAEAIRQIQEAALKENAFAFYGRYLRGLGHGGMGVSQAYRLPVAELVRERIRPTLSYAGAGLLWGWAAGMVLALAACLAGETQHLAARVAASAFLCLPSAALALILLLRATRHELYPLGARARGVSRFRLAAIHLMWPSLPAVLNLLVVYIPVTFGLAVALETFCDVPGLGQLAWLAAQQRDLPVLVSLSMLVLGVTVLCGSISGVLAPEAAV
jgi:peptide/nickel transport system permease protein